MKKKRSVHTISPFLKKDACYYSVKARYDVFPSAYASGAIAKCRKAGDQKRKNKLNIKRSWE
jgi:hypothetical protein